MASPKAVFCFFEAWTATADESTFLKKRQVVLSGLASFCILLVPRHVFFFFRVALRAGHPPASETHAERPTDPRCVTHSQRMRRRGGGYLGLAVD